MCYDPVTNKMELGAGRSPCEKASHVPSFSCVDRAENYSFDIIFSICSFKKHFYLLIIAFLLVWFVWAAVTKIPSDLTCHLQGTLFALPLVDTTCILLFQPRLAQSFLKYFTMSSFAFLLNTN